MAVNTIKTLTLTLGSTSVECQLDQAELVDNPSTETITTFCDPDTSSISNYELRIGGFQDYGAQDAVCDMLHSAYTGGTTIAFVLTVGSKTRTGSCKPTADVPFGGTAGAALKFSTTLDVIGTPVDGDVAPAAV